VTIMTGLTVVPQPQVTTPADHHDETARAYYANRAAERRDYERMKLELDDTRRLLANSDARIAEMELTIGRMNERERESMNREAASHTQAASLAATIEIMLSSGQAAIEKHKKDKS